MGPKHKTNFKEGDRINDSFTLIKNYSRPTTEKGKNEWLWECKCDCGNIFSVREYKILNRYGCHSCTNKKTSTETALKKKDGISHYGLKNRLYKDYRIGAAKRGINFKLTFDEFIKIMECDCAYCGKEPSLHQGELQYMQKTISPWLHNGIDRIDSSKDYELGNVVPCCSKCNYAKHEMSKEEFYEWVKSVYSFLFLGENISKTETYDYGTKCSEFPQYNVYRNKNNEHL